MIDVKQIKDIPDIESYMEKEFTFGCYDFGDGIRSYYLDLNEGSQVELLVISDDKYIFGKDSLKDILKQDNITYLSWNVRKVESKVVANWSYRPLVDA